jgi:hypothetical protein
MAEAPNHSWHGPPFPVRFVFATGMLGACAYFWIGEHDWAPRVFFTVFAGLAFAGLIEKVTIIDRGNNNVRSEHRLFGLTIRRQNNPLNQFGEIIVDHYESSEGKDRIVISFLRNNGQKLGIEYFFAARRAADTKAEQRASQISRETGLAPTFKRHPDPGGGHAP